MKRWVIRLRLLEDILVGSRQAVGNLRISDEVIPGRTWRGAFAAALQRTDPAAFERLFGIPEEDQIAFGPLFPGRDQAHPLPPTAYSSKYKPGFKKEGSDDPAGVYDTLVRQFVSGVVTQRHLPAPMLIDDLSTINFEPGTPCEPFQGFRQAFTRHATTHVGLNRARHVAEDGLLYTREGIEQGVNYSGWLEVPNAVEATFKGLVDVVGEVQIGANRSRGMGLAQIDRIEVYEPEASLEARQSGLNAAIREVFDFYRKQTGETYDPHYTDAVEKRFVTVGLRSPAVLEDAGLPTDQPDLSAYGLEVVRQWTSWETVGGWNAAARLPRRTRPAVTGVYLCRQREGSTLPLEQLELDGLGLLRAQGFGQLTLCDPVHQTTGWQKDKLL